MTVTNKQSQSITEDSCGKENMKVRDPRIIYFWNFKQF